VSLYNTPLRSEVLIHYNIRGQKIIAFCWNVMLCSLVNCCSLVAILWHCANDRFLVSPLGVICRRYWRGVWLVGYKQLQSGDHSMLPAIT
jgi:hypothetical protein